MLLQVVCAVEQSIHGDRQAAAQLDRSCAGGSCAVGGTTAGPNEHISGTSSISSTSSISGPSQTAAQQDVSRSSGSVHASGAALGKPALAEGDVVKTGGCEARGSLLDPGSSSQQSAAPQNFLERDRCRSGVARNSSAMSQGAGDV